MSTYAIGDLQGCYSELQNLLDKINFDASNDHLWFAGDLVNRGPDSLACLRFVKSLGKNAKTVLGNHDLHLLAVANKVRKPHRKDTFDEILNAEDSEDLYHWIRQQPFLINEPKLDFTMVHAGFPPEWTLEQAKELAKETESLIQSNQFDNFIHNMYGDQPDIWSEELQDDDRHRFIINCFTRIRYIDTNGKLNLKEKCPPGMQNTSLTPWYDIPERGTRNDKIVFGHWSTVHLGKEDNTQNNIYPVDTGCLWGRKLTAMRLEDEKLFSVPSQQKKFTHDFIQKIYDMVSKIPEGKVATYGQIAKLIGYPNHSRYIGHALSKLKNNSNIPWHRVVNAKGQISLRGFDGCDDYQKILLESESVIFNKNIISLNKFQWHPVSYKA